MKKIFVLLWLFTLLISISPLNTVYAGSADTDSANVELGTLIPQTAATQVDCKRELDLLEKETDPAKLFNTKSSGYKRDFLACAIMTGRIHLWMIPYYVVYLIEFLIGIAGLVAILFLVMGGFQYVASGLSEAKDKAKNTIKNALLGLGVALAAWTVVNLVQYIVTL